MEEEEVFNINGVVKSIYDALSKECEYTSPGLIIMFSKYLPCRLKGDEAMLTTILFQILHRLIRDNCELELILSMEAPEDFVYLEPVIFKVMNLPIKIENIYHELQQTLSGELKSLDATLESSEENGGSLVLTVPLSKEEIGERRYYRLPSSLMLHKNILLVLENMNDAIALTKMFRYFPMNVDLSMKKIQSKYALEKYDMIVIDQMLYNDETAVLFDTVRESHGCELVVFGTKPEIPTEKIILLERPVTQQDVFDLLVLQFWVKPRQQEN